MKKYLSFGRNRKSYCKKFFERRKTSARKLQTTAIFLQGKKKFLQETGTLSCKVVARFLQRTAREVRGRSSDRSPERLQ